MLSLETTLFSFSHVVLDGSQEKELFIAPSAGLLHWWWCLFSNHFCGALLLRNIREKYENVEYIKKMIIVVNRIQAMA